MGDCCGSGACSTGGVAPNKTKSGFFQKYGEYGLAITAFLLLAVGIVLKEVVAPNWFTAPLQLLFFGLAYLPVGGPVLWKAITQIGKGNIFNEFFLMGIATIGAFLLGEYAEGVAVMLFYSVGELFQGAAVNKAKKSIESLLKIQAEEVAVVEADGTIKIVHPSTVAIGSIIQVKPGEKVAIDGILISEKATFNTAALTGEPAPDRKYEGEKVLAGMVNLENLSAIKVTSRFEDSKLSKILEMVREAASRKAKTQRFITRFAKIYTPIVFLLATAITLLPYFFMETYVFGEWLYRALVFLVVSCPCALMISIPLGYFGGIGAASRNGILFKGSNYLDQMRKVDTVVMDKTGTLTKGVFEVQHIKTVEFDREFILNLVTSLESSSNHPVARAVTAYCAGLGYKAVRVEQAEEISGMGMKGQVEGFNILAGNTKLLKKYGIPYDTEIDDFAETTVVIAINEKYCGFITIADEIKEDAKLAVDELRQLGVKNLVMLSGDKEKVVQALARELGLDLAIGGLLPEGKIKEAEKLKKRSAMLAFIGDGINDAPVITLADIGVAMGGLGSDAAIETADVVIQNDQPSKTATAIRISKATNRIVWQNIGLAFGVKFLVLSLGAFGMANMWEAVFADVGVTLLAILNAVRIQKMDFPAKKISETKVLDKTVAHSPKRKTNTEKEFA
ncbi:cadmium-translocating P-type ATPase [Antarcticibacterium sp. 1MA-6-2]|uniref:heavy metal translocating P-type ATPase n=1 Tax=Antarcticibacterium sp. 1MA-6-2 TaxID=2908210 RepID=UPI001F1C5F6E|nr:heavy metal translocating P-type ATPase [Antarcticibacterium sp. 1MA-6-2]UJH91905.1 cadmium-translocating P-type ATPase [Antarcticibacterium sp. 1MA-6-2]